MITVYGTPHSRSTRITWMLEELNQPFEFKKIDFAKGEHRSDEYLAINPGGKVPAIKIDDDLVTESGAIVTHLADRYSSNTLIPVAGTKERAEYEQWAFFALCELEQPLWTIGKHKFALPEEQRVAEIIPTAVWEFQRALALLSEGLADKPYILGEEFSAADILLTHTLIWAVAFKQTVGQENLQAYLQRCQQRSALKRAIEKESA